MAARRSRAKGTGGQSAPRKGGTPAHRPTPESRAAVAAMASIGSTHEVIARAMFGGMSPDTLRRHYANELDNGKAITDAAVTKSLAQKAIEGNVVAAIFYLKTRCGWRETDAASSEPVTLVIRRELAAPSVTPAPVAAEPSVVEPPEVAP